MKLQEKGVTLLEDSTVYSTKVELMLASDKLVRSYFEMKGELK